MKAQKYRLVVKVAIFLSILFPITACSSFSRDGDEPDIPSDERHLTVLVYAVASNDLEGDLETDKAEMLEGVESIDMRGVSFLLYQVTSSEEPALFELSKNSSGQYCFNKLKQYDKSLYSTDPLRISEVVHDARDLRKADKYGLILWSHGTGIDPSFSTHGNTMPDNRISTDAVGKIEFGMCFSFGADKDIAKNPRHTDATDIDELADALPDSMFDFIWADACYMSGIETVYELKNKCRYFVGYPTEVIQWGMPYNLTLPYILKKQPDLVGAAKAFFNFYGNYPDPYYRIATVCVVDMSALDEVASECRKIYSGVQEVPSVSGMNCYTRRTVGPFYDFAKYTEKMAGLNNSYPSVDGFQAAMKRCVLWREATDVDFSNNHIDRDNFCGLSCCLYDPESSTSKADYYRSLKWFNAVYK